MPSISALVRSAAVRVPDREALIHDATRLTYAQLDTEIEAAATRIAAAGIRRGDRFAIVGPNCAEWIVAFFAGLRAGAIVVPVNAKLAVPELAHVLADSGAALIAIHDSLRTTVERAAGDARLITLGDGSDEPGLRAGPVGPPLPFAAHDIGESDDAIIMYTSGTTGRPKGVLLDHHRAVWAAHAEIASLGLRDGERYLHLAPLYHSGGVVYLVTQTLLSGTHVVLGEFDAQGIVDTVERERCSYFLGVPTMFAWLLKVPGIAERDLSSWRLGVFGAAPMPRATLDAMIAAFPDVELVQLCGQTEAGPGGIYATAEQVRGRPDATGRQAMVFYESRVVDPSGADVPDGGTGEIVLRGPGVMKGYWNQPEATAETIRDGWLHTGDLAQLDADGFMTIVDRLKDMVITGGQNVYSIEVETALVRHPGVAECAVVGRQHEEYGESIVAVIVPADGHAAPTCAELRVFAAEMLARYKLPHDVVVVPELPRNPGGKVLKHELRATVAGAQPAR